MITRCFLLVLRARDSDKSRERLQNLAQPVCSRMAVVAFVPGYKLTSREQSLRRKVNLCATKSIAMNIVRTGSRVAISSRIAVDR